MTKCELCNKKADLIKEKKYYCATHYIELFMNHIHKKPKLKNKIAGRLCHNRHIG